MDKVYTAGVNPHRVAVLAYVATCLCILFGAYLARPDYPVLVICGESSMGTWLSGMMLVTLAVLSMLLAMQRRIFPWVLFTLFFTVLSLDERFMFHEYFKERLLIALRMKPHSWQVICELPVMIGSVIGAGAAALLWKNIRSRSGRVLLSMAVACGTGSVVIDILCCGVLWEDSLKLIAEMCLVSAFIGMVPLSKEFT